jgi:hypothetical protein
MSNISTNLSEEEAYNFVQPKKKASIYLWFVTLNDNSVFMVPLPRAANIMGQAILSIHSHTPLYRHGTFSSISKHCAVNVY